MILEEKNVDIQTIDRFKKSEEELQKYGLSMESPRTLVSVLQTINKITGPNTIYKLKWLIKWQCCWSMANHIWLPLYFFSAAFTGFFAFVLVF